jgi:hypothetical protein
MFGKQSFCTSLIAKVECRAGCAINKTLINVTEIYETEARFSLGGVFLQILSSYSKPN